jgi:hypothetical protein
LHHNAQIQIKKQFLKTSTPRLGPCGSSYIYLCNLPITTKVVSLNPTHSEVYSIHYVIEFVSDLRQVCGFLQILRFPPSITLTSSNKIVSKWLSCFREENFQILKIPVVAAILDLWLTQNMKTFWKLAHNINITDNQKKIM